MIRNFIKQREFWSWLLSFALMIYLLSTRPLSGAWGMSPVDLLFSLQSFACFFCSGGQMLIVTLLAAAGKDLLFGQMMGPSLILAVGLVLISYIIRDIRLPRKWGWSFVFASVLHLLYRILKALLFQVLPLRYKLEMSLDQRVARELLTGIRSLPGILLGLLMIMGIFYLVSPDFYKEETWQ